MSGKDSSIASDEFGQKTLNAIREALENDLERITPEEAVERYLDERRRDLCEKTLAEYAESLDHFIQFCAKQDIENLNDLNGRDLSQYRKYRREEVPKEVERLAKKTERDEQYLLRNFLRHLGKIEAVPENLHLKVTIPSLNDGEGVSNTILTKDRATNILDSLSRYEYGTLEHVTLLILCTTGGRTGSIQALDVRDVCLDEDGSPYLSFKHRPETDTPLKNDKKGEREVTIPEDAAEVLSDYLDVQRPNVEDEYERKPLLATEHGRISKTTIRKYVYKWTRPCELEGDCPHDKEISSCEAAKNCDHASKCPSSRSPHDIRRGYLTAELDAGIPGEILSDRCDLSKEVLEKHYDERSERQKRTLREKVFAEVHEKADGGYHSTSDFDGGESNV